MYKKILLIFYITTVFLILQFSKPIYKKYFYMEKRFMVQQELKMLLRRKSRPYFA